MYKPFFVPPMVSMYLIKIAILEKSSTLACVTIFPWIIITFIGPTSRSNVHFMIQIRSTEITFILLLSVQFCYILILLVYNIVKL